MNKKDDIIFEVINLDRKNPENYESLGEVRFSLGMINNQEEYDVVLEIPDMQNDEEISATINAKIQFIWSFYRFYSDKLNLTEENIYNLQISLQQKRVILKHLNGILFTFFFL